VTSSPITIRIGAGSLTAEALLALYREVGLVAGLAQRGEGAKILEAFRRSYRVASAWEGERLVGAARLVSDGITYGTVFDVGVLPEYQKRGIGKRLVLSVLEGHESLYVHVTSTFGNEAFYEKLGFSRHKTAFARYPVASPYLAEE
jgi:ribosomal protein S18 acetylase RimI-like enzyme